MADYTRSQLGRAAAILTTGEVAGTTLQLAQCKNKEVNVDFSFTLGSLTNVVVRAYASMDGSTFVQLTDDTGAPFARTETATCTRVYSLNNLAGFRSFRLTVQGTGTVTSSSCTFTYRFDRLGS